MIIELRPSELFPDKNNPRILTEKVTPEEIEALADSLESNGQLTPLRIHKNNKIENGYRRYLAGQLIERRSNKPFYLRCEVIEKDIDEMTTLIQQSAGDVQQKNWKNKARHITWEKIWIDKGFDENSKDKTAFKKLIGCESSHVNEFLEMRKLPDELRDKYNWEGKSGHLTESRSLPEDRRFLIIEYALKRGVGAMIVRQEAKVLKNVSLDLVKSYVKGEITLEQVEQFSELKDETQDIAIQVAKKFKEEEKKIAPALKKNTIKVEVAKQQMNAQEFISKFQSEIFNVSFSVTKIDGFLEDIKEKGVMKHFDNNTKNMLKKYLNELSDKLHNLKIEIDETIEDWDSKSSEDVRMKIGEK